MPKSRRTRRSRMPRVSRLPKASKDIPQLPAVPTYRRIYRFQGTATLSSGSFSVTLTSANILAALGCVATSTTSATSFFESFRIRGMRVWAIGYYSSGGLGGVVSTVNLSYFNEGSASGPTNLGATDTSISTTVPAAINFPPPPMSLASFWVQGNGSLTLGSLNVTSSQAGSMQIVADLDVECNLSTNTTSALDVVTTSGLTSGDTYYFPLDGPSGVLFPAFLPA